MMECMKSMARKPEFGRWIPVDEMLPDPDRYILVSFENFSIPIVGRYTVDDEDSGTFRLGDEDETFIENDLYVNAWMYLPECYRVSAKDAHTEKPQTNADRIRSMTDKALANLLEEVGIGSFLADKYPCSECGKINCDVCFLEWLQAESEG